MKPTPELSVVLPIFNERENIVPLVDEIHAVLTQADKTFEIIVIDDGSTDGSGPLLKELVAERDYLKLIRFRGNSGQTAALDAGLRHSSGEVIVTMDSDLQNDPHDIPKMLELIDEGHDAVLGWRHDRKDKLFVRKIPSKIANFLIRTLWKSKLHDLGCALKVFRREVAEELRLYGEMHRFIGLLLESSGANVAEYKVNHRPRVAGHSKYSLNRTFKVLLDMTTLWFLKGYRTKPIYIFGGVGGVLWSLSGLLAMWVLYDKWMGVSVHRNPLFLIAIFFAVVGVQFIVLGLLAELLIRTYFESTDRPPYSIANKMGFAGGKKVTPLFGRSIESSPLSA